MSCESPLALQLYYSLRITWGPSIYSHRIETVRAGILLDA